MKRMLLVVLMIMGLGIFYAEAQFLKEIRDRAIERSKDVIIGKTADKAADKTSLAMDKLLNPDLGSLMNRGGSKVDMARLPDFYSFDYRYALKITTAEGDIDFDVIYSLK